MSVEVSREGRAKIKLFQDWDKFNTKYIEALAKAMVKNQDSSPLTNRFQRKTRTNRTYRDLKDKTLKQKDKVKPKQQFVMQASGDTKRAVKNTTKGKVKGQNFILSAKVPQYAADHNNAKDPKKRLQFFSLNGKNGRPLKAEVDKFNKIAERVFNQVLAVFGVRTK